MEDPQVILAFFAHFGVDALSIPPTPLNLLRLMCLFTYVNK